MRIQCLGAPMAVLLLAVSAASQTPAHAKVKTKDGLQTASFNVTGGSVFVYLPDDMRAGDHISGTVVGETFGQSDKERDRNRKKIEGLVVSIAGQSTTVESGVVQFTVPADFTPERTFFDILVRTPGEETLSSAPVATCCGPVMPEPLNPVSKNPTQPGANNGPLMPEPLNPVSKNPTQPGANGGPVMPEPLNPVSKNPTQPGANGGPLMPEPLNPVSKNPTQPGANNGPLMPEPLNPVSKNPTQPGANGGPIMPEPLNPVRGAPGQPQFMAPPVVQAGHPFPIYGPFDGNAVSTRVTIGSRSAPVLAESPRETVVATSPDATPGTDTIVVRKTDSQGTAEATGKLRIVSLSLLTTKSQLRSGEKAELTVQVAGLTGLEQPIPLQLENATPGVIQLEGGDKQQFIVDPAHVDSAGNYTTTRTITGVKPGKFNIDSGVIYQEPTPQLASGTAPANATPATAEPASTPPVNTAPSTTPATVTPGTTAH